MKHIFTNEEILEQVKILGSVIQKNHFVLKPVGQFYSNESFLELLDENEGIYRNSIAQNYIQFNHSSFKLQSLKENTVHKYKKQRKYIQRLEKYFLGVVKKSDLYELLELSNSIGVINDHEFENLLKSKLKRKNIDSSYFIYQLKKYIENSIKLAENLVLIKKINKVQSLLNSLLKKFNRNQRDFFRKINSFLFKNLDDYHSSALISVY